MIFEILFSEEEQKLVGTVLEQFRKSGFTEIWLGGSDIGHDEVFTWADGSNIGTFHWTSTSPQSEKGTYIYCFVIMLKVILYYVIET